MIAWSIVLLWVACPIYTAVAIAAALANFATIASEFASIYIFTLGVGVVLSMKFPAYAGDVLSPRIRTVPLVVPYVLSKEAVPVIFTA